MYALPATCLAAPSLRVHVPCARNRAPLRNWKLKTSGTQAEVGMSCHAHPFSKRITRGVPVEIQNLLSLHSQFQCLGRRCHIVEMTLTLICGFQFVTAVFVVSLVERHTTTPQAAAMELRALVTSDLIRSRDLVQRLGNRLSKRLKALNRRAVDALVALGPDACVLALEMWHLEEKSPGFFIALNKDPPPPPPWTQRVRTT